MNISKPIVENKAKGKIKKKFEDIKIKVGIKILRKFLIFGKLFLIILIN